MNTNNRNTTRGRRSPSPVPWQRSSRGRESKRSDVPPEVVAVDHGARRRRRRPGPGVRPMSDWTVEPLNEADIAPSGSHDDCDGADDE